MSSLCDYSVRYIIAEKTITVPNTAAAAAAAAPDNRNKKIIFKNCAPFTDSTSEINNTQVNNATGICVVIPMFNLIECSDDYSKTSGSLRKDDRDEPVLNDASAIINFAADNNNNALFNFKQKLTGQAGNNGSKGVEI